MPWGGEGKRDRAGAVYLINLLYDLLKHRLMNGTLVIRSSGIYDVPQTFTLFLARIDIHNVFCEGNTMCLESTPTWILGVIALPRHPFTTESSPKSTRERRGIALFCCHNNPTNIWNVSVTRWTLLCLCKRIYVLMWSCTQDSRRTSEVSGCHKMPQTNLALLWD